MFSQGSDLQLGDTVARDQPLEGARWQAPAHLVQIVYKTPFPDSASH